MSTRKSSRDWKSRPVWIIGNGPSLTIDQLDAIKGQTSFATNLISKAFDKTDWRPTYYVVVSSSYAIPSYRPHILRGIEESSHVIIDVNIFNDLKLHIQDYDADKFIILRNLRKDVLFWSEDMELAACAWGFSHLVTFNYLEYKRLLGPAFLLGFDLGYKPPTDSDTSHFLDDYWDIDYILKRYDSEPDIFEKLNKDHLRTHKFIKSMVFYTICNASPHSELKIYPKVKPPA